MKKDVSQALVNTLSGEVVRPPPVWLMRQAGRYLPEYRALRAKAGSFWRMCMTPEMAVDITLQPIRRFGFDAAILFSDILVVPFALGREVAFEDNIGPKVDPISDPNLLRKDEAEWAEKLAPVYAAISGVREALDPSRALLGFAGAPWTLATYMVGGEGSTDQRAAKLLGYREPLVFETMLTEIADCVAFHLIRQLEAGADAVQLFDSWAGSLPESAFRSWVIAPTKRIVARVRERVPGAKIIGFPRLASLSGYEAYARETGVSGISVDTASSLGWLRNHVDRSITLQGNLDPIALIAGGSALASAVDAIVDSMEGRPFIFNLGHGVLPETPVEHVEQLVARLRGAR